LTTDAHNMGFGAMSADGTHDPTLPIQQHQSGREG